MKVFPILISEIYFLSFKEQNKYCKYTITICFTPNIIIIFKYQSFIVTTIYHMAFYLAISYNENAKDDSAIEFYQKNMSLNFQSKLQAYLEKYGLNNLKHRIRCKNKNINYQIEDQFILEWYDNAKQWEVKWILWPQKLYYVYEPRNVLNIIGHVNFVNLQILNVSNYQLKNIQGLGWMNCPNLKIIELKQDRIVSLKSLSKWKFDKLLKLQIKQNMFNHHQLQYFSRSLSKQCLQNEKCRINLTQPYMNCKTRDFSALAKCSLQKYLNSNIQYRHLQKRVKNILRKRNSNVFQMCE